MNSSISSWDGCPEFESNLKDRANTINHHFHDWFHLGVGDEGSGKSTLGLFGCLKVDPTFNIDRVVFTLIQFKKALKNARRGHSIMVDELGEVMYSRDWNTKDSKELAKYLMICRYRGLHVWMNIPRVEYADIFVRRGRLGSMTRTLTTVRKTLVNGEWRYWRDRGYFRAYTKETVENYFNKHYYLRSYQSRGYERFPNLRDFEDTKALAWQYDNKKDEFGMLKTDKIDEE